MRPGLFAAAISAAFFMTGCAALESAAGVVAKAIDEGCERGLDPLALEARRATVASINERTMVGNHTPSDCDGDGKPDFEIDADGMPIAGPVSEVPIVRDGSDITGHGPLSALPESYEGWGGAASTLPMG